MHANSKHWLRAILAMGSLAVALTVALTARGAVPVKSALPEGLFQASGYAEPQGATVPAGQAVLGTSGVPEILVSPATGGVVSRLLDGATLGDLALGFPFGPDFGAGLVTAIGELTGDSSDDIVIAMGPGGGLVRLYNGATVAEVGSGYPFGPNFVGGVSLAIGDLNGDGRTDLIVGQASGGGAIRVFSGADFSLLLSQNPFGASYAGGVNVAAGDVDGDGRVELFVGQARDGLVSVISGATQLVTVSGAPYGSLPGGIFLAGGDVNGDGRSDIVIAPGSGTSPVVAFDLNTATVIGSVAPYGATAAGGVRVATADLDGDGRADIITVPGPGREPELRVYSGATFALLSSRVVYPAGYTSGVFVSATMPRTSIARFTSGVAATFVAGSAGNFTVSTAPRAVATPITLSGALPAGITFASSGNGTATLSGTATAGSGGTYPVTFSASNGSAAPTTQNFVLTVNEAPVITSAASTACALNAPCTFSVTTNGFPRPTLIASGVLPPGVTFTDNGNGTATLAGTATGGTTGTYPLTISATNGVGAAATQPFVLTVQGLVFTSANATTFLVGSAGNFTISTSAVPVATTVTVTGALPAGVTFSNNGNGTGTLMGTPAASTGGVYSLTLTASNGSAPVIQAFTLTVQQAAAITSASSATFAQGAAATFTVVSTGFPTANVTATGALPSGVTFVGNGNGTGTLAGTPAPGSGGVYAISFSAGNGVGTPAGQSFTLNVSAPPEITSSATTTFTVGAPGAFTVTSTGGPTSATVGVTGTRPSGVTFVNNGNGTATLAGTPAAATGGVYPLTFSATNGVGSPASQSFTLTVNQAPAITSANATGFVVGTPGSFAITATAFPAATLTATGALPTGVTFVNNGNGTATLAGTPAVGTTGTFPLTVGATNGVGTAASQGFTLTVGATQPSAQDESYFGGVGNTQFSVGAGAPATPAVAVAGSVLANDAGQAPLTAGPATIVTTNGGLVALAANGAFLYTPALGFAGPSDTFTYTVTDGNGGTDTAVVTIDMSGVVWYVNASASAGDGRSHSPFNAMAGAAAAAQASHVIYVHAGAPSGATTLKPNQTLWGAGAAFALNGLTIGATTPPVLNGTVTLANGVLVNSLSVNGGAGAAIAAAGLTGTETLNAVSVTGGTSGLSLTALGGTFTMAGGTIGGLGAGPSVLMSGGSGMVTLGASITSTAGRSVDIQGRTAGGVTFTGPIVDTGTGILLNGNTGSSIAFSGGLALATTVNAAFTASGGGTVTATQNNTSIVNTITTTTAQALAVSNTQIGGAGLTFRQISAGLQGSFSAGVGITLDNTGVAAPNGGLTITGNGTAQSGGIIRRKSGADGSTTEGIGIFLRNTKSPSFRWMELSRFDNAAIVGRSVAGFTLADSVIFDAGTTAGISEGPVVFGLPSPANLNGLVGAGVIRNTLITGAFDDNVSFFNQSGSMSLLLERTTPNPGDCLIGQNSTTTGGRGLVIQMEGTAASTVTVDRCRFRNNRTTSMHVVAAGDSSVAVQVTGSSTDASLTSEFVRSQQGDTGVILTNSGNADLTATVENAVFTGFPAGGIRVGQTSGNASAQSLLLASIINNRIETPANSTQPSILARLSSTAGAVSSSRLLIAGNGGAVPEVRQFGLLPGVLVSLEDPGTSPAVDVTYTTNHVDMDESAPGSDIRGPLGVVLRASVGTLCTNVLGNTTHWYPLIEPQGGGLRVEQSGSGVVTLERGAGLLSDSASVVLSANNPPPAMLTMVTEALGAIAVVGNGSCAVP